MSGFLLLIREDGGPAPEGLAAELTASLAFRARDGLALEIEGSAALGQAALGFRGPVPAAPSRRGPWRAVGSVRLDRREALASRLGLPERLTDLELALGAWERWGEGAADRLAGDLSLALWNVQTREAVALRDRYGVAQLLWARAGGLLAFSNTLETLRRLPGLPQELDRVALLQQAVWGMYLDPEATAYRALRRLPPAGLARWTPAGGLSWRVGWTPPAIVEPRPCPRAVEEFSELLERAVADRLPGGPLTAHLSGGMDSTSLATVAADQLRQAGRLADLQGCTIGWRWLIPDPEERLAAGVARRAGFAHLGLEAEQSLAPPPAASYGLRPEPGPPPGILWDQVSRLAAARGRGLMMGFGGDAGLQAEPWTPARALAAWRAGDRRWALRAGLGQAWKGWRVRRAGGRRPARPAWLDPGLAAELAPEALEGPRPGGARFQSRRGLALAPLWRALFAQTDPGFTGLPVLPVFPLFDAGLIEWLDRVPPSWLSARRILREAMRGRLPEDVRTRPKTPLPMELSLRVAAHPGVVEAGLALLAHPAARGWVDPRWVEETGRLTGLARARRWSQGRPPLQLIGWLACRAASLAPVDPGVVEALRSGPGGPDRGGQES